MLSQPVPVGRDRLAAATRSTRLIFLVSGIGMAAWAPMVPYAKARLGLDDAQLGLMLLAFGGGSMASMPFVGWLSHRFGNRRVILASGWLLCLALPVLALAPNVAVLTAALLYFGVMLGAVDVAMNAHAVEVERRDGRVLMSGFHGLFSLGGLAGAAGMSVLLALGLPLPLAALAVSALLAALVLYLRGGLLPNVGGAAAGHAPFRMPHGAVLLLGLLCFVSFMAEGSMLDWSAVFLRDFRGFAPSAAGIGYACFSVAMALGRLTGDRLIQRIGPVWAVRVGAGLAATGFALAASVPWPGAALAGFVLVGLGASNIVPVMFSAAGRLPGSSPAIAIAAVTMLGYAGLLSGPALIGFISRLASLPLALAVVAGLLLLVAASARIVRR
ncbi:MULTISPECIES: MFS transporter [unclassified Rhodanobacter]|uniref:MFS transporter n=1 Tax=Rhodanobacter humi TaxID=1888173 RepID=A0ABV4AUB5_9GAMM